MLLYKLINTIFFCIESIKYLSLIGLKCSWVKSLFTANVAASLYSIVSVIWELTNYWKCWFYQRGSWSRSEICSARHQIIAWTWRNQDEPGSTALIFPALFFFLSFHFFCPEPYICYLFGEGGWTIMLRIYAMQWNTELIEFQLE